MGSRFQPMLCCLEGRRKSYRIWSRLPRVGCGGIREKGAGESDEEEGRRPTTTPIILLW
jgi:hypothetical protein